MKILAFGDIHGDQGLAKKLAKIAKEKDVDLVLIAGDITLADLPTKNIIKPFEEVKKQVLLIHGNHEPLETITSFEQAYKNAKNLHGYSFERGNLGIFGAGGTESSSLSTKDSDIFKMLEQSHNKIKGKQKKIMITHMHPESEKFNLFGFEGSKAIKKAIQRFHPDIAICAHLHEAGGLEEKIGKTKVINVARSPAIFEI